MASAWMRKAQSGSLREHRGVHPGQGRRRSHDRIALPKARAPTPACSAAKTGRTLFLCTSEGTEQDRVAGRSRGWIETVRRGRTGAGLRRSGYAQQFHRGARDLQVQFRSARYGLILWPISTRMGVSPPRGRRGRASCVPLRLTRPRRAAWDRCGTPSHRARPAGRARRRCSRSPAR